MLPPEVADRIAAGEVVERPASVVRELLDNALDAGASRVEVDLAAGGVDLCAVADDGSGIAPEDARLAFERHATSKIETGDDLDRVTSLGFRGEALAAIGAVARVELLTRPRGGAVEGRRVVWERGRPVADEPGARAPGTTVTVRDLFAGIPARRKFLKSPATELDHALAAVTRAALARWEVGFRVRTADDRRGGPDLLIAPPAARAGDRIASVLGDRWAAGLVELEEARGVLHLHAWAGRSDLTRPTREGLHLFVNRRPVRDPVLQRAVLDAYRPVLPPGRFPVVVLYLEIPPDAVDVNVHPAKSEVRFERPNDVRGAVFGLLTRGLGLRAAIPVFVPAPEPGAPGGSAPGPGPLPLRYAAPAWDGAPAGDGASAPGGAADAAAPGGVAEPATTAIPPPRVRALAQYRQCYIVAEDERGLLVVDQHVAHERLLYESLLRQADQGPLPRQSLLFPVTLETGPEAVDLVEREAALFARAGFGVEPFGRTAVVVREVPAILGREAAPETFLELVERLRAGDRARAEDAFRDLLATVACHTAVRKGMAVPLAKADYILQGLDACEVPSHCPHGRVISVRVDLAALDRTFDRVS